MLELGCVCRREENIVRLLLDLSRRALSGAGRLLLARGRKVMMTELEKARFLESGWQKRKDLCSRAAFYAEDSCLCEEKEGMRDLGVVSMKRKRNKFRNSRLIERGKRLGAQYQREAVKGMDCAGSSLKSEFRKNKKTRWF